MINPGTEFCDQFISGQLDYMSGAPADKNGSAAYREGYGQEYARAEIRTHYRENGLTAVRSSA